MLWSPFNRLAMARVHGYWLSWWVAEWGSLSIRPPHLAGSLLWLRRLFDFRFPLSSSTHTTTTTTTYPSFLSLTYTSLVVYSSIC
jgi:hypothetical protein